LGVPPATAAIEIGVSRRTPAYVAGGAGKTDHFCVGEPAASPAPGWEVVELRDGWYQTDAGGGVAVWGQGLYWEIRDTPFTVCAAAGPGAAAAAEPRASAVDVRGAIFGVETKGVPGMTDAKLAPNMPGWMVEHANRYAASGGNDGHLYKVTPPGYQEMTVPSLLLTTTGRKSGERFVFPLFYGTDGGRRFIVASKGGAPQHPGWYRNLAADPEVEVQVGTEKFRARARTATGAERARLWQKALEFWPPYADYQQKTTREIPVVVLDPIA
jgi:proline iminopeptidase